MPPMYLLRLGIVYLGRNVQHARIRIVADLDDVSRLPCSCLLLLLLLEAAFLLVAGHLSVALACWASCWVETAAPTQCYLFAMSTRPTPTTAAAS